MMPGRYIYMFKNCKHSFNFVAILLRSEKPKLFLKNFKFPENLSLSLK